MPDAEPYICLTCGVQHAASEAPPERCLICNDERQYVGWGGQRWTTLLDMKAAGHANRFRDVEGEPGLTSIDTRPRFAIGQRALLVQTRNGNFLWDCISYIDEDTVQRIRNVGGLHGISASHPHFYGAMIEWSHAFGGAPVFLPLADKQWLARPDHIGSLVRGLEGDLAGADPRAGAAGTSTAARCCTGLKAAEEGRAAYRRYDLGRGGPPLGDLHAQLSQLHPSPEPAVRGIVQAVQPYPFERIYGGWWENDVMADGMGVVERSAERYITWTETRGQDAADAPK